MKKYLIIAVCLFVSLASWQGVKAQHTLGFTMGYGMANGRFQPQQEMRAIWGTYSGGVTWRYYGKQRIVGGFGIDLEFVQQGFSFATNASLVEDKNDKTALLYYTRKINTLMLPIVWQPHVYMFKHRLRLYMEAAATFSYNLSSTWEQEDWVDPKTQGEKKTTGGTYDFKLARDNRWGYGLAGGAGLSLLIKQFELNFRARYYFGYSDIVRNRNKYANNAEDGPENPFYSTPMRSPLDNLTISIGLSYRFNKEGFDTWKPRPKRSKNKEVFKYGL